MKKIFTIIAALLFATTAIAQTVLGNGVKIGGASTTSGVSSVIPGTNVTCTPNVAGSCTGPVTISATGGGGGGGLSYPSADMVFIFDSDSTDDSGDLGPPYPLSTTGLVGQFAANPFLNQGNTNSGVDSITSCSTTSHVTTMTYTGTAPRKFSAIALAGLTGTNCSTLNTATASPTHHYWTVTALGTGTFSITTTLANSTEAQSGATATIYGRVVDVISAYADLNTAVATYSTLIHPYTFAVTGFPCTVIDVLGAGDMLGSSTPAIQPYYLQGYVRTLYANEHADGCKVIRDTILPTVLENSGGVCVTGQPQSCNTNFTIFNVQLYSQMASPSTTQTNVMYDNLVNDSMLMPDPNNSDLYWYGHGYSPTAKGQTFRLQAFLYTVLTGINSPAPPIPCGLGEVPCTDVHNTFTSEQDIYLAGNSAVMKMSTGGDMVSYQSSGAQNLGNEYGPFRVCVWGANYPTPSPTAHDYMAFGPKDLCWNQHGILEPQLFLSGEVRVPVVSGPPNANSDNRGSLTLVAGTVTRNFTGGQHSCSGGSPYFACTGEWDYPPTCYVWDATSKAHGQAATSSYTVTTVSLTINDSVGTTDTYGYLCMP